MKPSELNKGILETAKLNGVDSSQETDANFNYISKPNHSLSIYHAICIFSITLLFVMTIALGFAMIGAWPVLIYAFAVLIGLSLAFQHHYKHVNDFEKLTIQNGMLYLEIKELEEHRKYELNAFWANLTTQYSSDGDCKLIALQSHGREFKIGRHISAEKRNELAKQLKNKLLRIK